MGRTGRRGLGIRCTAGPASLAPRASDRLPNLLPWSLRTRAPEMALLAHQCLKRQPIHDDHEEMSRPGPVRIAQTRGVLLSLLLTVVAISGCGEQEAAEQNPGPVVGFWVTTSDPFSAETLNIMSDTGLEGQTSMWMTTVDGGYRALVFPGADPSVVAFHRDVIAELPGVAIQDVTEGSRWPDCQSDDCIVSFD